ncbi:MAG: phenylalanine--tRNA ligase subunit alpha [Candidatus Micrarchaeota archaeon]
MYKGEDKVLELVAKKKKLYVSDISRLSGMNVDSIRRIVESLRGGGFVKITKSESSINSPTPELISYAKATFPEFSVYAKARKGANIGDLSPVEKQIGLRWAKLKGLIMIEAGKIVPAKEEGEVISLEQKMKDSVSQLVEMGNTDAPVLLDEFFQRHLVQKKIVRRLEVAYTNKPLKALKKGFDVSARGPDAPFGKKHPTSVMSDKIRSIMAELGFEEMEGSIVESSFWNFDALFQPQDHPARELADTFYLEGKEPLPKDKKLVERVKKSHEDGWKYRWNTEDAEKPVLRTHTTCLSARHLAALKDRKPKKFFAIGKVFRNEATDYSHLAEFYQVEGIIAWENATFRDLLGTLKEFYRKLGFEKIRFRPSFFPYTEPSLEIEVYFEPKKQWLELGGAGMFRPEVSEPLAGIYPVLAWGLSLERPLMMLLDLDDIRSFYKNDLDFLKSVRVD